MADITLAEAQAELVLVNIAIQDILMGKSINELKLGSGEFNRWYKFTDVSLSDLMAYRTELRSIINALTPDVVPIFRTTSCIPIIVRKGIC